MKIRIITFDPKKGKQVLVGDFENGILYKRVTSAHFMIKEQGYGIQEDVIERLKELNCEIVRIIATTKTFDIPFIEYLKVEPKNYGNGPQRFVKAIRNISGIFNKQQTTLGI